MPTIETRSTIPPELMAELHQRAERVVRDIIDPEARMKARERMDRMREEFRRRHGEVNLAVELIREARDDACTCWIPASL